MLIKPIHLELVKAIYFCRCLTFQQILVYYANREIQEAYELTRFLFEQGWIEIEIVEDTEEVYFLTSKGVDVVREILSLPKYLANGRLGYLRAHEIKVKPRLLAHQTHTIDFALGFIKTIEALDSSLIFRLQNEKCLDKRFNSIRPDFVLMQGEWDIILEMDMRSENLKQLREKAGRYSKMITKQRELGRKMMIFFIHHKKPTQHRLSTIYQAFGDVLGMFSEEAELYIGTQEQLLEIVKQEAFYKLKNQPIPREREIQKHLETVYDRPVEWRPIHLIEKREGICHYYFEAKTPHEKYTDYLILECTCLKMSLFNTLFTLILKYQDKLTEEKWRSRNTLILIQKKDKELFDTIIEYLSFKPNSNIQYIFID